MVTTRRLHQERIRNGTVDLIPAPCQSVPEAWFGVLKLLRLRVEVQVLLGALTKTERELLLGDIYADALSTQPVPILEL